MLTEGQEILEGRFKIIKKLGSGAFGEIFKGNPDLKTYRPLVEKKKTGEFFAAKVVSSARCRAGRHSIPTLSGRELTCVGSNRQSQTSN
jgi:hypothetical protein